MKFKLYFERYISSIYFAVTTMLTVGYGDISGKTPIEKVFCSLSILITCCVFAYAMSVIGTIIDSMDQKESEIMFKFIIIN